MSQYYLYQRSHDRPRRTWQRVATIAAYIVLYAALVAVCCLVVP